MTFRMRWAVLAGLPLAALIAVGASVGSSSSAPASAQAAHHTEAADLRRSLQAARAASTAAQARAKALQDQAAAATAAEDKARLELASLAAQLQNAEARAGVAEAQLAVVQDQRARIDRTLAAQRKPLVELAAALQRVTARPLVLSALQPGSLREAVYLRAMLDGAVPAIRSRTARLRAQLARSRRLAGEARAAVQFLRRQEEAIGERRSALLAVGARNRRIAAQMSGAARREAQRSADLALEARNLDELVGRFDEIAVLRTQLAALPGPVMRPPAGQASGLPPWRQSNAMPVPTIPQAMQAYRLPVIGRITGGFGDAGSDGSPRTGLALAPRPGALVVAPAAGRIAFAGPYRGFGAVIIIEHPGGWTTLVTGLASLEAAVGERVPAGSPLGAAPMRRSEISVELRHAGKPVDPLAYALRDGG